MDKRDLYRKYTALTLLGTNRDGTLMHDDRTLCDGKAQACSSDLPGVGFVHSVKSLVDMSQGILRNTYTGIMYLKGKILMVRIEHHLH